MKDKYKRLGLTLYELGFITHGELLKIINFPHDGDVKITIDFVDFDREKKEKEITRRIEREKSMKARLRREIESEQE